MKLVDTTKQKLNEIITKHCTAGKIIQGAWTMTHMGRTISMDDDAIRLLSKAVDNVMEKRPIIKERFAEEYVKNRLIDIIFSCHLVSSATLDATLLRETKKLIQKLQRTIETWIFLVPVVNLKLTGLRKMSIGKVDFYNLNLRTFKYLETKFSIKLGYKKTFNERQSELVNNNINVLAVTEATAGESEKAKIHARLKVESSLDILRLYDFTRHIGIQREFFATSGGEDIYYKNTRTKAMGSSHARPPPASLFPFFVDKAKLNSMRRKGYLGKFNKLLRGQLSTKMAEKIAMSIHWYGSAVKDTDEVSKFVKLIVALESLLLSGKDRLKKQSLADRAAFILGRDKDTRKYMNELLKRMYSIRSEIVHDGKHEISKKDALTLIALVRNLIFAMMAISTRMDSLKEIDERIQEIKFGSHLRGV